MVKKKDTFRCACTQTELSGGKHMILDNCKCRSPGRVEKAYEKVFISSEEQ